MKRKRRVYTNADRVEKNPDGSFNIDVGDRRFENIPPEFEGTEEDDDSRTIVVEGEESIWVIFFKIAWIVGLLLLVILGTIYLSI